MGESFPSKPAMISLLVLVATASCAPQYGPPPPLPSPTPTPEKLIAPVTPAIACTVTYVTVWDTEYHDNEKEVCVTEYEQQCSTIYKNVSVPKEVCISVADEVCKNEPLTKCEEVPRQACHKEHRRVPIRVSKAVPKKSCATNQVLPPSQFPPTQPQLPAVQPRPFPEAPEVSEVFIPQPVPV